MSFAQFGLLLFAAVFSSTALTQSTVYKYRDESGRWVYTDKKPADDRDDVEVRQFAGDGRQRRKPHIKVLDQGEREQLVAVNPLHAPVLFLWSPYTQVEGAKGALVDPASTEVLLERDKDLRRPWDPQHISLIGEPLTGVERNVAYLPPVPAHGEYVITQAFGGRFSHQAEPSRHAVDIAMPFGTTVHAARGGTVIDVKDDYHLGSADSTFFLDKANYLRVLHEDGSYAVYAHIAMGSATVQPGAQVTTGQPIARSGNSGFSTGPHLHFCVQFNKKRQGIRSVPFLFALSGAGVPPQEGMLLSRD